MRRALALLAILTTATAAQEAPSPASGAASAQVAEAAREISAANLETTMRALVACGTRNTFSDQADAQRGIGAARRWIQAAFAACARDAGDRLVVELDEFTEPPGPGHAQPVQVVNVVATLRGEQAEARDRVYVVSGHYDSRCSDAMDATSDAPGADDDASGVAAVIELARVMSRRRWDATLVFIAFAGEEQGLYGSTHWARMAQERHWNIAGMITNDIIGSSRAEDGRIDDRRVRLFAEGVPPLATMPDALRLRLMTGGENDSPARELGRFIAGNAEHHLPGFAVDIIYRRDRFLRGGDHSPFLDAGFAAVRMTEPHEDFRHQHQDVRTVDGVRHGDLLEFCDFAYAAQVARVNAIALGQLALAPAPPAGVVVEVKQLENRTVLRWQAGAEPDLAGYEVLWRDTTAPLWQHALAVGKVTTCTLPEVSKDDVVFGLRAVDRDGNASPASYPLPVR